VDNPPEGCYLDAVRLLASLLLLLLLAVPARAFDDEDATDSDPAEFGSRLRALDDTVVRDAEHPETMGDEEPEDRDPLDDVEEGPRDPYDDEEPAPAPRRDAARTPPAKPERYPNPLESAAPSSDKGADGKGAEPKSPLSPDAGN
jgi:hypothetical protein